MATRYEPESFEAKWRQKWEQEDLFRTREDADKPKFYGLDFFPYPSGAGLSVGHCRNFVPTDVLCRMKYMQGFNVLHPMGFDCFGLPAENEAIKTQSHPAPMIDRYAKRYQDQMTLIGISYDWSRSFKSSDPRYYRWTQWIFELLYSKGLAYRDEAEVNWCPKDKTALANEEVVGGLCERCGTPVVKKSIPQWYFKITDYAQRLLDDLDGIDWPEGIKNQQRNWIGRSEGVEFSMKVHIEPDTSLHTGEQPHGELDGFELVDRNDPWAIRVFTTRIDTIYGMSFCVIAPEHPLVKQIALNVGKDKQTEIQEYVAKARSMGDQDRQATNREKTGVDTGAFAINPANGKKVPIFIADYVLTGYGTGAIMAVPGHDDRDFAFAEKFGLDIIQVISPEKDKTGQELPFSAKEGFMVNSGSYSGLTVAEGQKQLTQWVESEGIGEGKVNFKLRDWLISRQRYWGCPIPIIYDKQGYAEPVAFSALPVELPEVENYQPSDDGSSPLARIPEFVNATTSDGNLGQRETDTLGGFACSSWYFLRFCDPHNEEEAWGKDAVSYWMPVDCYVGGAEHAVMHLLYARFWTKVLFDAGLIDFEEPFQRLMNQGQVLAETPYRQPRADETLEVGEDGILISFAEAETMATDQVTWKWVRMSKSKGNVVTPEEAVEAYGADALRLHELFVAPFEQNVQWHNEGMQGQVRFLSRVFKLVDTVKDLYVRDWQSLNQQSLDPVSAKIRRITHQLIQKASHDIEKFAFNTYVAAMMSSINELVDIVDALKDPTETQKLALSEAIESFILILSPAAPHSADELWESLGHSGFTYRADWPRFQSALAQEDVVTIAIQVNGKLRDTLELSKGLSKDEIEAHAKDSAKVQSHLEGLQVLKVIVVPDRLVNFVAK